MDTDSIRFAVSLRRGYQFSKVSPAHASLRDFLSSVTKAHIVHIAPSDRSALLEASYEEFEALRKQLFTKWNVSPVPNLTDNTK